MCKSHRSIVYLVVLGAACMLLGACGKAVKSKANDAFAAGRVAQNHGDYKTAIADYDVAAQTLASDPKLFYDRGVSYYNIHEYKQADADLSEALRLVHAGHAGLATSFIHAIAYFRGLGEIQEGQWAAAKDDLRLAVVYYPKSWLAWDSLGYARAALGDYRNALPDYNHGLHIYPKDAIDHNNRGLAYYHSRQQRAAVADFTSAIHLSAKWGVLYQNRGEAYFAAADYRDADRDFTRAIALIPKAWSWAYRCETRENLNEVKAALSDCNRALAYYPTWAQVYIDRAWAEATLGANKRALADANEAVKLAPHYALAYTYRGWVRQRMMQYRAAFVDYDQALRLNPHDVVASEDRTSLGNFVVAAQRAGVRSFGIATLNVAQMENEQEPSKSEYEQRASQCGGYFSESDSYFDDCVNNGVDQAKDDEASDQEAADQAQSEAYNAQQQIQEQINYQQQEEENAAAQSQEDQNYAQGESENYSSGYSDNGQSEDSSGSEGETESAPAQEAPVEEAPPEEESGGGG